MRIATATKSAQGRAKQLTAERLVNLYAEAAPGGSKSPVAVHGCPGLARFCDDFSIAVDVDYSQNWQSVTGTDNQTDTANNLDIATDGADILTIGDDGAVYLQSDGFQKQTLTGWSTDDPQSCAYSPTLGLWVVVGTGGKISTSPDGTTWTARTSGTANTIYSIDYGSGRFIAAVGTADTVLTSTDGITWSTTTITGLGSSRSVAYSSEQGRWVVLGDGYFAHSDNGTSWTKTGAKILATTSPGARKVTYGGGTWVAIWTSSNATSSFDTIAVSSDGQNWTTYEAPVTDMNGVRYTDDFFTLTTNKRVNGDNGGVFTSNDGTTWSELSAISDIDFNWFAQASIYVPGTGELWITDSQGGLYHTGGENVLANEPGIPRGFYRMARDGKVFLVAGLSLYIINEDGTSTAVPGTIAGSGRVGMADNGDQLCIVTGSKGYIYESETGLYEIADKDFPGAETVAYLDGFFIFNNPGNGQKREQFFISNLRDGANYDALDFASAEAYPDNLKRVVTDHSELILFGEQTTEIWFNAGAADFPFRRAQGSIIEKGLGATWSVAQLDESVIWLDQHGIVRRLQGGTPVRMSTHDIEYRIKQGDWENATAWSYYDEGHNFYVLTVPRRNTSQTAGTYVYDAATGLWHERKSKDRPYSRSGFYVAAYGKHLTCDIDKATIYEQSLDVYEENEEPHIAEMVFPQVQNDGERFIVDRFQVDLEVAPNPKTTAITIYPDPTDWEQQGNSLDISPSGNPAMAAMTATRVAFIDDANDQLRAYDFDGTNWSAVGSGLSVVTGRPALAALDSATVVFAGQFANVQTYTFDGTNWSATGSGFSISGIGNPALAALTPTLVAMADSGTDRIRALSWNGSTWSQVGNLFTLAMSSPYIAAIDSSTIAIADSGFSQLRAYRFDGTNWSLVGSGFNLAAIRHAVAGIDANRVALIREDTREIQAYDFDGSTWSAVGNVGSVGTSAIGIPGAVALSSTQFAFAGATEDLLKTFQFINPNEQPQTYNSFFTNPQIMLQESADGRTWGMLEEWHSLGEQGEYSLRVKWDQRGQYTYYTPKITISSPVSRAIFAAYAKIRPTR